MNNRLGRLIRAVGLGVMATAAVQAFDPITDDSGIYVVVWERGTIPMVNNLPNASVLLDGMTFRGSAEAAMAEWNGQMGNVQFTWSYGAEGVYETGNDVNEIVVDSTIGGFEFGDTTLAVTLSFSDGGNYRTESDVVFNSRWEWDSYRGAERNDAYDAHRVAVHEFGHVLGLGHPDQASPTQSVDAIMNSTISEVDGLLADDISGARYLYGAPNSPPANDNFANATELVPDENGDASLMGTTVQSTSESGEPVLDSDAPGGRSAWWSWTASGRGLVNVTTLGSRFDTVLGVFTGSAVDGLTTIGINDDVDPGIIRTSTVGFLAQAGVTYYFMVDGWDGYEGSVQLNLRSLVAPPPTVSIDRGRVIAPLGENLTFTATGGSSVGGELSYQWRKNNQIIAGATGRTLTINTVTNDDVGAYSVVVSESRGSIGYATAFVLPNYAATEVVGWGIEPNDGSAEIPAGLTNVVEIAVGGTHALALRANGTVSGWGGQSSTVYRMGQETPPSGLSDVVAIAAGNSHSLALRSDGTVVAWGGRLNQPAAAPGDLRDVIAITAGINNSAVLMADGRVAVWGLAADEANFDTVARDVTGIWLEGNRGVTLHTDGRVRRWNDTFTEEFGSVDLPDARVVGSVGGHVVALGFDGRVYAASLETGVAQTVPDEVHDVVSLAAGGNFSFGVRANGTVVGWGETDRANDLVAFLPEGLSGVVQVDIGTLAMALRTTTATRAPVIVEAPEPVVTAEREIIELVARVGGDNPFSFGWKRDGMTLESGDRITGAGTARLRIENAVAGDAGLYTLEVTNAAGTVVSTGAEVTVAQAVNFGRRLRSKRAIEGDDVTLSAEAAGLGTLRYRWWHGFEPIPTATSSSLVLRNVTLEDAGRYTLEVFDDIGSIWTQCYVQVGAKDGEIVAWDADWFGIKFYAGQVPVTNEPVVEVEVEKHGLALLESGRVLAWSRFSSAGTAVPAELTDVVDIAAGEDFSVALRGDGTVVAWGLNTHGQTNVPADLKNVVAIKATYNYALALRGDGTVVGWGGETQVEAIPVRLDDVVDVSIDANIGVLLHRDGHVSTWNNSRLVPDNLGTVDRVIAGRSEIAVIDTAGAVHSWDVNGSGLHFAQFETLTNIRDIAQGLVGGMAVDRDGAVSSWNEQGYPREDTPSGLGEVVDVAVGNFRAVVARAVLPQIGSISSAVDITAKQELVLTVAVQGVGSVTYQWFRGAEAIVPGDGITVGADGTLRIASGATSHSGDYTVQVSNAAGVVTSAVVPVLVRGRPEPTVWPTDRILLRGEAWEIDLRSTKPGVTYEWFKDGAPMADQPGAILAGTEAIRSDAGYYRVVLRSADAGLVEVSFVLRVVEPDSSPAYWGELSDALSFWPVELSNVRQYDLGWNHVLVLLENGSVLSIGREQAGETHVPAGLSGVVQVAAGASHSLALLEDGSVVQWNEFDGSVHPVPANLPPIASIDAGHSISMALSVEGELFVWGWRYPNATGAAQNLPRVARALLVEDGNYIAVLDDGTVRNYNGTYGTVGKGPAALTDVAAVFGTWSQRLVLKRDGSVIRWGYFSSSLSPVPVAVAQRVREVSFSGNVNHLLLEDGSVTGWVENSGQEALMLPSAGEVLSQITTSGQLLLGLAANKSNALRWTRHPVAQEVAPAQSFSMEAEAAGIGVVHYQWLHNGRLLVDGGDISGADTATLTVAYATELTDGTYTVRATDDAGTITSYPVQVSTQSTGRVPSISVRPLSRIVSEGETLQVAVPVEDATRFQWRRNREVLTDQTTATLNLPAVTSADEGYYELWAANNSGSALHTVFYVTVAESDVELVEIHRNDTEAYSIPDDVGVPAEIYVIYETNIVLRSDGSVRAWGEASEERLGALNSLSGVVSLSPSSFGGLAVSDEGRLVGWGDAAGFATRFADLRDVVACALTDSWAVVLLADGTVRAGSTSDETNYDVPADLVDAVAIDATYGHAVAVRSDGSVVVWSRLMDEDLSSLDEPADAVRVQVARDYNVAQLRDGSLQEWILGSELPRLGGFDDVVRKFDVGTVPVTVVGIDGLVTILGKDTVDKVRFKDLVGVRDLAPGAFNSLALVSTLPPVIVTAPADVTLLPGGSATLSVQATGVGAVNYQWRFQGEVLRDGDRIVGSKTATLTISDFRAANAGDYDVLVYDDKGSRYAGTATVFLNTPIVVTDNPMTTMVSVGDSAIISVAATGTGPFVYQWYRDGVRLEGETAASIGFTAVVLADRGRYEVEISNTLETVRSAPAWLSVLPSGATLSAAHVASNYRYTPGGDLTIQGELIYDAATTAVTWSVLLPEGWTLSEIGEMSAAPTTSPSIDSSGLLEWSWATLGEGPLTFSFSLRVAAAQRGPAEITSLVEATNNGQKVLILAEPDPLEFLPGLHSADVDGDQRLNLSELLRVIELYNTRFGSTRTGRYRLSDTTEDGFDPDTRDPQNGAVNTRFHSADFNRDGRLGLAELLRIIELYNTRSGSTRTGAYRLKFGTEDGFAAGAE